MEETITTEPASGGSEGTESQATPPTTSEQQVTGESQKQGESQVETPESQATSKPAERPPERKRPPVSFYAQQRREREERKWLTESVRQLMEKFDKLQETNTSSARPKQTEISEEDLWKDFWSKGPKFVQQQIEDVMNQRFKELTDKVIPQTLESRDAERVKEFRKQEAWDMLFPKSSPNSTETIEERVHRDPKRAEAIVQIIEKYGLNKMAENDPVGAATVATEMYRLMNPAEPAKTPLAPKKSQMGSTSSGSPPGGSKMETLASLRAKYDEMMEKLRNEPTLLQNDAFKNEWETIRTQMAQNIGERRT